jgi:hypothetical protein
VVVVLGLGSWSRCLYWYKTKVSVKIQTKTLFYHFIGTPLGSLDKVPKRGHLWGNPDV